MRENTTLQEGLLGHWPGDRTPDGIVRDRSPEGNDGNYGLNARWIWFTNPRAVRHVGDHDRTYFCYLGGPTGRDIVVAAYDHCDGNLTRTVVEEGFSADDHANPSIFVCDDGHVLLFWAGHNGDEIYEACSTAPESVANFERLATVSGESVTYPNPMQAPTGELYLFYRDRTFTRDATDDRWGYVGDGNLYYRTSGDRGETWSGPTLLATPPEGHYSMYFVPAAGNEAIHLFLTDAERGGDAPKWNVMYAKLRGGDAYAANDERIATSDSFPLRKDDLDVVYDSTASGNSHAWVWDAAVDDEGNPVVAYATFPSTLGHEYRYARHDGEHWHDHHLADAGRYVARRPIELHYSGGLSIDRDDPTTVYGCVSRGDDCILRRYETETGGRTWSEMTVTRRPNGVDVRPVVPRNASDEVPVLWLTGSYKHMDTSQTVLRGLPSDRLAGDVLESDGTVGVDLGLDLYDGAAFTRGLTVSAEVTPADPASSGVVANFGGAVALGSATGAGSTLDEPKCDDGVENDDDPSIGCELVGPEETATVSAGASDGVAAGVTVTITAVWDGETLALSVDGEVVDETAFAGPLAIDDEWASWTLLRGEYLIGSSFEGAAADVRLYNRSLSDDEVVALATR